MVRTVVIECDIDVPTLEAHRPRVPLLRVRTRSGHDLSRSPHRRWLRRRSDCQFSETLERFLDLRLISSGSTFGFTSMRLLMHLMPLMLRTASSACRSLAFERDPAVFDDDFDLGIRDRQLALVGCRNHRDHDFQLAPGRGFEHGAHLQAEQLRPVGLIAATASAQFQDPAVRRPRAAEPQDRWQPRQRQPRASPLPQRLFSQRRCGRSLPTSPHRLSQ